MTDTANHKPMVSNLAAQMGKIISRLLSDNAGEREAAALAFARVVKENNLDPAELVVLWPYQKDRLLGKGFHGVVDDLYAQMRRMSDEKLALLDQKRDAERAMLEMKDRFAGIRRLANQPYPPYLKDILG
ncbi:hypothetical protein [Azospirillum sp.]|uniref:hypothetical protein n=1 Tax=Azospirillum sp. TaxID=34012 RepID=UPI002D2B929C|nr:hypothetical protein [Azospirillum sp.]HYF86172.1 hypothetical protein [Azospirillum sp.]